jgi:hypothetical protein
MDDIIEDNDEMTFPFEKNRDKTSKKKFNTKFITSLDDITNNALALREKTEEIRAMIQQEYRNFEYLKQNAAREREIMKKRLLDKYDEVIELNVGGTTFTTLKSTLSKPKDGMLAAMFGGNFVPGIQDKNGRWFLDRPSEPFDVILNALRTDNPLKIPEDEIDQKVFAEEIKFYGLQEYFKNELSEELMVGSGGFPKCSLLNHSEQKQLSKWIGSVAKGKKWKLLFKATKDGFQASKFRQTCCNTIHSVTIVKSVQGYIFGGFNAAQWSTNNQYQFNQGCFLFSFKAPSGNNAVKLDNNGPHHSNQYSTYNGANYGPTFGGGHDLYICDNSNVQNQSYTNLGHSYSLPGYTYGQTNIQSWMAGSYNFTTAEIEVYGQ